eukprot:371347_1
MATPNEVDSAFRNLSLDQNAFELAFIPVRNTETFDTNTFELASNPVRNKSYPVRNKSYFTLQPINQHYNISIVCDNNKFIQNGNVHDWNDGYQSIASRYWRCGKYYKGCKGAFTTHKTATDDDFGKIVNFTPHSIHHDNTWTSTIAENIICLQTMKHSLLSTNSKVETFKQFQRFFPMQSIKHFHKFRSLKSFLDRYMSLFVPRTPGSIKIYCEMLQNTSLGHNFWKQQLNCEQFANKSWDQIECEFKKANCPVNIDLHPELKLNENALKLIEITMEKRLLDIKENYYRSKLIGEQLPDKFTSDLFLTCTNDYDVVLQSNYGGWILSHYLVHLVHIDFTFTKPFVLNGTAYAELGFIVAQLNAPSIIYTHNQYPCALLMMTSKTKQTHTKIFTAFKEANKTKYDYNFENITKLSTD